MKYKFLAEILFIIITVIIAYLLMTPVINNMINFNFIEVNYFCIILFLMYSRYIFLLKLTPFSHSPWIKLIFIFTSIPILFYLTDEFFDFTKMLDEEGIYSKVNTDSYDQVFIIGDYVKFEFLFFLIGAFITTIIIPIRMIISIYRVYNKKEGV
jgi:hypothetical protein